MEPPAGHTLLDWPTDRGHNSRDDASAVRHHRTSNTVSSHDTHHRYIINQSPVLASRLRRSPQSSGIVRFLYLTSYYACVFHYPDSYLDLPNFSSLERNWASFLILLLNFISRQVRLKYLEKISQISSTTAFFCKILNANSLMKQSFYYFITLQLTTLWHIKHTLHDVQKAVFSHK